MEDRKCSNVPQLPIGRQCVTCEDERNTWFELQGRNEVPFVKVWGWTNQIPLEFPNLKPDLCMPTLVYKRNELDLDSGVPKDLTDIWDSGEVDVETLGKVATRDNIKTYRNLGPGNPLGVLVLAKRKAHQVFLKPKHGHEDDPCQVLVLGQLVVADPTGACLMTFFNEATGTIHSKVQPGDYLIIEKVSFKLFDVKESTFSYPFGDHLHNLELKIDKYWTRKVKHIPFMKQTSWIPELGGGFIPPESKLWTPKELWENTEFLWNEESLTRKYLDVAGVVSFVGRIERTAFMDKSVRYFDEENKVKGTRMFRVFNAYRWIMIVDKELRPFPLKLVVHKDTLDLQKSIVPGAIVVLTNCFVQENQAEVYLTADACSQGFVNEDIEHYCKVMPLRYREVGLMNRLSYSFIIKNYKNWGIGGTVVHPVSYPKRFYNGYKELIQQAEEEGQSQSQSLFTKTRIPPDYRLARRERYEVTFRGKIQLVQKIMEKDCNLHMPVMRDPLDPSNLLRVTRSPYVCGDPADFDKANESASKYYWHPPPCLCSNCQSAYWFHWPRRVDINLEDVWETDTTRQLCKKVTEQTRKYCGPLLFPAEYPPMPRTCLPAIAGLPRLEPFDHYRVSIQDEESQDCYQALWKTYSMKEMGGRLKAAFGKTIIACVSIFLSEKGCQREIVLHDFVVEENYLGTRTDSSDLLNGGVNPALSLSQQTKEPEQNEDIPLLPPKAAVQPDLGKDSTSSSEGGPISQLHSGRDAEEVNPRLDNNSDPHPNASIVSTMGGDSPYQDLVGPSDAEVDSDLDTHVSRSHAKSSNALRDSDSDNSPEKGWRGENRRVGMYKENQSSHRTTSDNNEDTNKSGNRSCSAI